MTDFTQPLSTTESVTNKPDLTFGALVAVRNERVAQDNKWGRQRHSWPEWMAILGEEYGEACGEANRYYWSHTLPYGDALSKLREELVQTAAVAVAIIEHIDEIDQVHRASGRSRDQAGMAGEGER